METTNINIRINRDIKEQAQGLFASLGLDMTTAIDIYLRQAIINGGIPFIINSSKSANQRKPGMLRGKIRMTEDFDAPLQDFEEYMK